MIKTKFMFFLLIALTALAAASPLFAQEKGEPSGKNNKPAAVFRDAWFEDDVVENGETGVRVHVKFSIYLAKNLPAELVVRFFNGDDALMDSDGKYKNASGEVSVKRDLKPGYDLTDYNDVALFIPYGQLDLDDGTYTLNMDIDVNYKNGELLTHLTFKEFPYTQGGGEEDTTEGTKVNRIWVDYNVTRDGKKGMLVHVNFQVAGMKGVDALLAVRIRKGGDTYLENATAGFSNAEGEFEVTYSLKPGYDPAVYEDATVFIPYGEIVLPRGTWNLELDVDLRYENGELIEHLDFYEFEFKRQ